MPSVLVIRGGPATRSRLAEHARRTHEAFMLDGAPVWGVSVFCALDDIGPASIEGLLQRFASYRVVHLPTAGAIADAGFELLPTFGRPHYTVRLASDDDDELDRLLDAFGRPQSNPYHGSRRRR